MKSRWNTEKSRYSAIDHFLRVNRKGRIIKIESESNLIDLVFYLHQTCTLILNAYKSRDSKNAHRKSQKYKTLKVYVITCRKRQEFKIR